MNPDFKRRAKGQAEATASEMARLRILRGVGDINKYCWKWWLFVSIMTQQRRHTMLTTRPFSFPPPPQLVHFYFAVSPSNLNHPTPSSQQAHLNRPSSFLLPFGKCPSVRDVTRYWLFRQ